ncbi:hypothetical protein [Salarchaeum sp. JOR-1]|uniref:hypothetical protein n=1 Tax=Salarchaeum sp. JOR-1 TaxID=2599399 RepID=UPI0019821389|nr:hypothetical protein [Salarchaeum sp. JOR-1]
MSVLDGDGGVYTVVGENGDTYRVDAVDGRCTCPDARHNLDADTPCKHERRVRFATGVQAIPAAFDPTSVDALLGDHVDETPVYAATDGGDDESRPDDCTCHPTMSDLPCWPCYRDGFDVPASVETAN